MKIAHAGFALLAGLGLASCSPHSTADHPQAQQPRPHRTPMAPTAGPGEAIGVAECDAYVKSYVACINGPMPEAGRQNTLAMLGSQTMMWRRVAETPGHEAELAEGCTAAAAIAKKATQGYGCAW